MAGKGAFSSRMPCSVNLLGTAAVPGRLDVGGRETYANKKEDQHWPQGWQTWRNGDFAGTNGRGQGEATPSTQIYPNRKPSRTARKHIAPGLLSIATSVLIMNK